jgi:hypothetical protein
MFIRESETSIEASEKIAPALRNLQAQVFRVIAMAGPLGATDEEIILSSGLSPNTARPRRIELVNAGRVVNSGKVRKTRSGRNAVVWVLASQQLGLF